MLVFQAEDGIRDLVRSRGLGDVYKRQEHYRTAAAVLLPGEEDFGIVPVEAQATGRPVLALSLIHI